VALLQSTWLAQVTLWGAHPDLMVLLIIGWTAVHNVNDGLVWALIGGLLVDILSGGPLGGTVLALVVVALLAGQPLRQEASITLPSLLISTFVAVLAYHLALLAVLSWGGMAVDWKYSILQIAMPSAVLNTVLVPFVHRPLLWLERKVRGEAFTL